MAASNGGEEINGMADQVEVFEKLHGELVEESGALAAESGAGVTVVAVSPRSGEPRVSVFPSGGGGGGSPPENKLAEEITKKQEEVAGMDAAEVMAFEEQLRALRARVVQRILSEEKSGCRPETEKKLNWETIRKLEEAVGMGAAEVVELEERVQRVLQRISGAEKAGGCSPGKKLADEIKKKHVQVATMGAAEVASFEEQLRALRARVLHQIREEEEAEAPEEEETVISMFFD